MCKLNPISWKNKMISTEEKKGHKRAKVVDGWAGAAPEFFKGTVQNSLSLTYLAMTYDTSKQ